MNVHGLPQVLLINHGTVICLKRMLRRLLVAANFPSSPILVTVLMEALSSSETSVLKRVTRHHIPEDAILHSHRSEDLNSYNLSQHRHLVFTFQ
jgi:hypothetical protein